ncbi:MAG: methylhydantoinase [Rhodospirillaceae bacterium]|nr:methylhydantoinase [Rhodospirillaceae bacterium]
MSENSYRSTVPDLVTHEIIRGKLLAAADEMGIVIARCSMSPVIYEVLDFACGVCDPRGQLIVQTNGITLFTGTFGLQVKSILRRFADDIKPGDVFMTNDPFDGGTHTCDIALIKPVFINDNLEAFAIAVAHWSEVGGAVAGSISPSATEIYQEGIRFPGLRVCRDDIVQQDILELIRENTRLPTMCIGDFNAELAAVRIAETRLREIFDKYGSEVVRDTYSYILDSSELLSLQAIKQLPNGIYYANDYVDGDGITNEQIPVCAEVRISDDKMTFDFTGSSPQRDGPINCAYGALSSAVKTVFKALVDPQGPSNEGWFRPLTIICPEGTIFTATKPAPTGWYYEGSAQASELVWRALAELAPDKLSAGSYMSLCGAYFFGEDPSTKEMFVHIEPAIGGWGAQSNCDGTGALIATTDGDTYNYSIELFEAKFPLRINKYALNTEGGVGAGRWRGGFGVIREFEVLINGAHTYCSFGRNIETPWGLMGGKNGSLNYMEIVSGDSVERISRISHKDLNSGDLVRIVTGGGGGFGKPYKRPVKEVQEDFLDGYINKETAEKDFGVSLDENGNVDSNLTATLRLGDH